MTILATTELEAVNIILAAISEAPVATIEEDTVDDAQMALNTLRDISKQVQAESWHFNTDYDYPLVPDALTGKIAYPPTAAHVDAMDTENIDAVKRGGFLWNRKTRSFDFSGRATLKCKIVWMLDFEDLPQLFRSYIALRAARKFASDVMGDDATVQYTARDEEMARARAVGDDLRRADLNMLTGSTSVARVTYGRRPWRV